MDWYYAVDGQRLGPVDATEFRRLIAEGAVRPDTLVWRQGMRDWAPYGTTGGIETLAEAAPPDASHVQCVECGRYFPEFETMQFRGANVCHDCKSLFFQKLKDGTDGGLRFAGFWIRFVAYVIDYILANMINFTINFAAGLMVSLIDPSALDESGNFSFGYTLFFYGIGFVIAMVYYTVPVVHWGATPGKLILGLRIVRPTGEHIGYLRAIGRVFATILSAIPLLLGYVVAAFDGEKRALHDFICDTRVVYK
jgi:uncharacterized RDD family membrane protein YckC